VHGSPSRGLNPLFEPHWLGVHDSTRSPCPSLPSNGYHRESTHRGPTLPPATHQTICLRAPLHSRWTSRLSFRCRSSAAANRDLCVTQTSRAGRQLDVHGDVQQPSAPSATPPGRPAVTLEPARTWPDVRWTSNLCFYGQGAARRSVAPACHQRWYPDATSAGIYHAVARALWATAGTGQEHGVPRGRPEPLRLLAASGEAAASSELSPAHSSQHTVTAATTYASPYKKATSPSATQPPELVQLSASGPAYRTSRSNLQLRSASNTRAAAAEPSTARTEGTAAAALALRSGRLPAPAVGAPQ